MAEPKTYQCDLPHMQYIFKDGQAAWFIGHLYKTSNPERIAELDLEISRGHPSIRLAPEGVGESVLDSADIVGSMRERIRREIIAEEKAKMLAAKDPSRDMGTSVQGPINPTSSVDGPIALEASMIANAPAPTAIESVQVTEVPTASRAKLDKLVKS